MDALDYTVIVIVNSVLAYFVRKWISRIENDIKETKNDVAQNKKELADYADSGISKAIMKFSVVADKLETSIDVMNRNMNSLEKVTEVFKAQMELRNKTIEEYLGKNNVWLEEIDKEIANHQDRITKIETKCTFNHERKIRK